jgi:hypothetical protein
MFPRGKRQSFKPAYVSTSQSTMYNYKIETGTRPIEVEIL